MSFSQRTQRIGWHPYFRQELKASTAGTEPRQSVYQGRCRLGGVPVLERKPVRARYLRLEIIKPGKTVRVQLAESRCFAPLAGAGGQ
jgi:hypothetical protein